MPSYLKFAAVTDLTRGTSILRAPLQLLRSILTRRPSLTQSVSTRHRKLEGKGEGKAEGKGEGKGEGKEGRREGKAGRIRVDIDSDGATAVDVKCAEDEPMRAC